MNVTQRLRTHVEGHLDVKHPCPYCSFICTRTNNLRLHKKKLHLMDYQLEKNFMELKRIGRVSIKSDHSCHMCDEKFARRGALKMHMAKQHKDQEDDKQAIRGHKKVSFSEIKALISAQLEGKGTKYSCKMCSFSQPKRITNAILKMRQHIESHLKVQVSCTQCEKSFLSIRLMKIHRKTKHTYTGGEDGKVSVSFNSELDSKEKAKEQCQERVKSRISKRKEHTHKIEKGNAVKGSSIIKRSATKEISTKLENIETTNTLTNEEISEKIEANMTVDKDNSGKKRYVCRICWESGGQRTPMLLHVELHLGLQLPCPHCDSREKTRSNLKLHMFNAHKK